jgi:L-ribulose-5-phosphate 3-epimerase
MNRRHFLKTTSTASTATLLGTHASFLLADSPKPPFKIGACDWSIDCRHDLAAFEVAKQIGLDGVEVSFGEPGVENDLRDEAVREQYLAASAETGIAISSLAMGVLNKIPFATEPQTEQWVAECIDVMPKLGVTNVLLAFFGKADIKDNPELQAEVIDRLKRLAPQAEANNVVLGLETTLDAEQHIHIVDAVNSPSVQVYYDVANMHRAGYDIYAEIPQLGLDRICQVHAKEVGFRLGEGDIDFSHVKKALDEIDYTGWLVIESARPKGADLLETYQHNNQYLRSLFPTT